MDSVLDIKMFGGFSMSYGKNAIDDNANRMKKVWLLLAYLVFCRNLTPTQDNYLSLMQGASSEEPADPNGRLKAMFYRARTMLDELDENAGHSWIIRKNGTYAWNCDVPLRLDTEEFEALCKAAENAESEDERLELYIKALDIYRGDFIPKLSMEPWVMPITAYYHQLYMTSAEHALSLLQKRERWEDMADIATKALKIEPYSEEFYQYLMRALIARKDRAAALRAYDEMSEKLFSTFGVMPSEESRALYREASREEGNHTVAVGTVREQLREPAGTKGALYCEYNFFKLLYQVQARNIMRSGETIHIALFSAHGRRGKDIARRSLDLAVNNLQDIIIGSLRQGDVVTRCSASQLIIMLPQANYENSCLVCKRIVKAFARQYPHSPVDINFSVQPLEPHATGIHHEG